MNEWYDRQGRPLSDYGEIEKLLRTFQYKRVAETVLPEGKWVSTVWLGLNHRHDDGPPLIFETMVFPSKDGPLLEIDCLRYSTEAEALAGHAAMVAKFTKEQS